MEKSGDVLGYARISTSDQDATNQRDRLEAAGAIRVFEDVISGKTFDRPGLNALIDYARSGDSLCVIRLDRLGRSLKELLETVDHLKARKINLISLQLAMGSLDLVIYLSSKVWDYPFSFFQWEY